MFICAITRVIIRKAVNEILMSRVHIKNYTEYLERIRDEFGKTEFMPCNAIIQGFISENHLYTDWGIVAEDVKKDIYKTILCDNNREKKTSRKGVITSYRIYLQKIRLEFGIPDRMPVDSSIDSFVKGYDLDANWGITIEDVKADLCEMIAGNYDKMYSEAKEVASKTVISLPISVSSNDYEQKRKCHPEAEVTFLLDGDNHFDEGQKGVEHTSKYTPVKAFFAQRGAKDKFKKITTNRPNVMSKYVKPGNQAVDRKIIKEADKLLEKRNQIIIIVSQDKGYERYYKNKVAIDSGNSVLFVKSVKEGREIVKKKYSINL